MSSWVGAYQMDHADSRRTKRCTWDKRESRKKVQGLEMFGDRNGQKRAGCKVFKVLGLLGPCGCCGVRHTRRGRGSCR